jgi:hypothetical protein
MPTERALLHHRRTIKEPQDMKKTLIAFAVALGCALNANAQSAVVADNVAPAVVTTSEGGTHDCLMKADASTWASLGLNADQTKKANDIVAACKRDCEVEMKEKGTHDHAAMVKHEAELKAVLTPEQYTKYQAWCKDKGAKSDKTEMKK